MAINTYKMEERRSICRLILNSNLKLILIEYKKIDSEG